MDVKGQGTPVDVLASRPGAGGFARPARNGNGPASAGNPEDTGPYRY
jgi:hypothetical protein